MAPKPWSFSTKGVREGDGIGNFTTNPCWFLSSGKLVGESGVGAVMALSLSCKLELSGEHLIETSAQLHPETF